MRPLLLVIGILTINKTCMLGMANERTCLDDEYCEPQEWMNCGWYLVYEYVIVELAVAMVFRISKNFKSILGSNIKDSLRASEFYCRKIHSSPNFLDS